MAGPPFPTEGDSALLVAIPEAEHVVGPLRLEHDAVAADGIPAHVTVLYPFVPRDRLTEEVRHAISAIFRAFPTFDYRLERVARFGDTTVYLAPEPAEVFARLRDAVHARFPEHPPYGGVFDAVIPHLTVGDGLDGPTADALEATAREALASKGPVVGRATRVDMMIRGPDGRWSVDSQHALAQGR